jgi:glycogen(starch) synthase
MPSNLRVGLYTPNYPGITGEGGIGTYTKQIAATLAQGGHEVHVLTQGERPLVVDGAVHVHSSSTRHIPLVDRAWPGAGACWRVGRAMARLVREHKLDIVEFAAWEGLAPYFATRRKVPMVVRLSTSSQETIDIDRLPMTRARQADVRRERLTARMADVLVTHSAAHQRTMAEELGIAAERIRVMPLGIGGVGQPSVPREPKTIVYLGRLEQRKGTTDLLKAVPLVLSDHPDARFVLIGADRAHCPGGRTHAQYLEQDFPPAVREHVTLAGRLPDEQVQLWLQRATIFAAPSLYESFGLVFLEAMRWGTPVIGTTAGAIPEVLEDGKSGILVPPQQPSELAAAISALLANPERRQALGDQGRRRAETEFSPDTMAARTVALYSDTIQRWRK